MTDLSNIVEILAKQALGGGQQSQQGGLGGILGSVLGGLGGGQQQSQQGGLGGDFRFSSWQFRWWATKSSTTSEWI